MGSLFLALYVRVEGIIDRKLPGHPILIREAHRGESLGYGAQTDAFGRCAFLSLHVGCADNQSQFLQRWI